MNKTYFSLLWLLVLVPLMAAAQWRDETNAKTAMQASLALPELIYESGEHFSDINSANLDGLLNRIGDSRLVLLGEASHGTAEFYDMRARITRELIEKKGFTIIAVEASWPDAAMIDTFIRGSSRRPMPLSSLFQDTGFSRFPTWMWANHSVSAFAHWLKDYNQSVKSADDSVVFYGLDFYNLFGSIEAVLDYLRHVDPQAAEVASRSYACLLPWAENPSSYSRAMQSAEHRGCAGEVFAVWRALLKKWKVYRQAGEYQFFSAAQNARLVRNAERYYRTLSHAGNNSWNQRDQSMFETLRAILNYRGQTSKAVVWAHNLHVGDARATDMNARGEFNLGQRVRENFADQAYLVGFGTDHGTVAAASRWGGPMQVMQVRPAHPDSYERLFHQVRSDNFLLPLGNTKMRNPVQEQTRNKLMRKRLQRAIGVTYDPERIAAQHYSLVSLPRQFDEYIWFDETRAVEPLR